MFAWNVKERCNSTGDVIIKAPFITIEGIDGCGKTTLLNSLKKEFGTDNILFTREPFEEGFRPQIYDAIKKGYSPLAVMFLFLADRAEHVEKVIKPALQKNIPVISDRYMDSTIAYQGATLTDYFDRDRLSVLRDLHQRWATLPDLTILLDLDETEAFARLSARSDTYIEEFEKIELLRSIRKNFIQLAAEEPHRFAIVDAGKNPTHVFENVKEVILRVFPEILDR